MRAAPQLPVGAAAAQGEPASQARRPQPPRRRALRRTLSGSLPLGALALSVAAAWAVSARASLPRADFAFTCGGEVGSLDPQAATGVSEGRVLGLLYEGLVGRDPRTLEPIPATAESWDVSADGLHYVFRLRPNARWSNGDPLTAHDFEFTFRRLLEPDTAAPYAYELYGVVGARAYHTGLDERGEALPRDWSKVGVRATAERQFELWLARPRATLLQLLAHNAFFPVHRASLADLERRWPASWRTRWGRPENRVGNGPFALALRRVGDRMRFTKNPFYWDAGRVAFDTVDVLALEHAATALNMYLSGDLDWLDGTIPPALVPQLKARPDFLRAPYLGVYFYRLNTTRAPLDDVRVRRALAMSLSRGEICTGLLQAGQQPALTFVPWAQVGSYRSPPGIEENLLEARRLLDAAGFDGMQQRLPVMRISYNTSEAHRDVAEVVAMQWRKRLRGDVRLENQEWKTYLDRQERLDYDISRSSWIADYPDALSFLKVFQSHSENNKTGWSNERYDELLAAAEDEPTLDGRNALMAQAEAILLDEAPIVPLYSYVTQNLVDVRLGGFWPNELNDHPAKEWYWKDDAELAAPTDGGAALAPSASTHGPRRGKRAPAARGEAVETRAPQDASKAADGRAPRTGAEEGP